MTGPVALNKVQVFPQFNSTVADNLPKSRVKLEGNFTSSLVDPVFGNFRVPALSSPQQTQLNDWSFRLHSSAPLIEQHVEKRFSQLFVQAVLCYQTNYTFREGRTIHQGLGAHTLHGHTFQAAHSATVPCIYALNPQTNQETVFLYRSGFYDESNATLDVLKCVNDADRAIDEKRKDSQLRAKTIGLLNKAAKGLLTPEQVAKQFSIALLSEIDKSIRVERNAEVRDVLWLYRKVAEHFESIINNPEQIDRWLNVDMNDPINEDLSKLCSQIKSNLGALRADILTLIKKKIDALPSVIRNENHERYNETRTPNHFYDLYHHTVLKLFTGPHLAILEEATGIQFLKLHQKTLSFSRIGKTNALIMQNAEKINKVVREVFTLASYLQGIPVDPKFIESVSSEKQVSLRPGVYSLRYQMIQIDQAVQSAVKSKIEEVLNAIKNATTAKTNLETFFYHSLFALAKSGTERKAYAKLLNMSPSAIEQQVRELRVNTQAHAKLESHASLINNLAVNIRKIGLGSKRQIDSLLKQMQSQKENKNLDILFYKRLFDQLTDPKDKQVLEQLTRSEQQIDQAIQKASKINSADMHIQINQQLIAQIRQVATPLFFELQSRTSTFRRLMMQELRKSHGMSQNHFKSIYKKNYPGYPMSDGTLSNLENGLKPITSTIVQQLSEIFGVNKSLFYPSHFAEPGV